MANCSDCYNGCGDKLTTDQCVRYTGPNNTTLGIETGDTLATVEAALIEFLTSVMTGEGIILDITPSDICALIRDELPDEDNITALDLFTAIITAVCSLKTDTTTLDSRVDTIEANYTVNCLSGVSAGSGTHAILQAVITKLCTVEDDLAALAVDLDTNYVKLADLNTLIQEYLDSQEITDKAYAKMVPYVAYPYHGSTSNYPNTGDSFDVNGVGANYWEDVYLCNGYSGLTPDMRGRKHVGAIVGMGGGALDPEVDPAVDPTFNPNYAEGDKEGANSVLLTTDNLPEHTHPITDPGHAHFVAYNNGSQVGVVALSASYAVAKQSELGTENEYTLVSDTTAEANAGPSSEEQTGITTTGVNVTAEEKFAVNDPSLACLYIMYIPA